jgi:hypothetical protein
MMKIKYKKWETTSNLVMSNAMILWWNGLELSKIEFGEEKKISWIRSNKVKIKKKGN